MSNQLPQDPRLNLCDLYAFGSPVDPERTVLILTANPDGGPLHPDAVYRLAIDHSGDLRNDIAFSFVYSAPLDGTQTVDVYLSVGNQSSTVAAVGSQIFGGVPVSFGDQVTAVESGGFTFAAAARRDLLTTGREANVMAMVMELPNGYLSADPDVRIWGRCSILDDRDWVHTDRIGHPGLGELITDEQSQAWYRAGEPYRDREHWMGPLIDAMARTGGYTREEAMTAINAEGTLPDVLTYNPSRLAKYPNGRALTDDVIAYRRAFLTKEEVLQTDSNLRAGLLAEFPYLGPPR